MLNTKDVIRIIEAYNWQTGLIADKAKVVDNGVTKEFDGMWLSSLTDSTAKSADIECADLTSRMNTINEILEITTKPIIV